jgi:hypothetical protein
MTVRSISPTFCRPEGTIPLQGSGRFRMPFGVPSNSKPGVYHTVSFDTAIGAWVCGCEAGKHRGRCRHMEQYPEIRPMRAEVCPPEAKPARGRPIVRTPAPSAAPLTRARFQADPRDAKPMQVSAAQVAVTITRRIVFEEDA